MGDHQLILEQERKAVYSVTTIKCNNDTYGSPIEIAEAFSNYFFNTDDTLSADNDLYLSRLPNLFLFSTTIHEVRDVIRNPKITSVGLDGINPTPHENDCARSFCDILATVINLAFKFGIFPVEPKRGEIVPVFKKGSAR